LVFDSNVDFNDWINDDRKSGKGGCKITVILFSYRIGLNPGHIGHGQPKRNYEILSSFLENDKVVVSLNCKK